MTNFEKVKKFMTTFGQEVKTSDTVNSLLIGTPMAQNYLSVGGLRRRHMRRYSGGNA